MTKRLSQVWMSPEAKKIAKMRAAEKGITLKEWLDQMTLGKEKKKKGDDYSFF